MERGNGVKQKPFIILNLFSKVDIRFNEGVLSLVIEYLKSFGLNKKHLYVFLWQNSRRRNYHRGASVSPCESFCSPGWLFSLFISRHQSCIMSLVSNISKQHGSVWRRFLFLLLRFHHEGTLFPKVCNTFSSWSLLCQSLANRPTSAELGSFPVFRVSPSLRTVIPFFTISFGVS